MTAQYVASSVFHKEGSVGIPSLSILPFPLQLTPPGIHAYITQFSMVCRIYNLSLNKLDIFSNSSTLWHWGQFFKCGWSSESAIWTSGEWTRWRSFQAISGLPGIWLGTLPLCTPTVIQVRHPGRPWPVACYCNQAQFITLDGWRSAMAQRRWSLCDNQLDTEQWCTMEMFQAFIWWAKASNTSMLDGGDLWAECTGCPFGSGAATLDTRFLAHHKCVLSRIGCPW